MKKTYNLLSYFTNEEIHFLKNCNVLKKLTLSLGEIIKKEEESGIHLCDNGLKNNFTEEEWHFLNHNKVILKYIKVVKNNVENNPYYQDDVITVTSESGTKVFTVWNGKYYEHK